MPVRPADKGGALRGALSRDILAILGSAGGPMSGRALADHFRARGRDVHLSAVYRALAGLHARNRVKRIELTDSYIPSRDAIFIEALCDGCGKLFGISATQSVAARAQLTRENDFTAERYVIEMTGRCALCSDRSTAAGP